MSKTTPTSHEALLSPLITIINEHPNGVSFRELQQKLDPTLGKRAIQYRLRVLVHEGRVRIEGGRRWAKYLPVADPAIDNSAISLSSNSKKLVSYVRRPVSARDPKSYNTQLIEQYQPNQTNWLSDNEKQQLLTVGSDIDEEAPAGTYARRIMDRLLIDLSWNSSRLEGNTYSLLDTRRLINFDEEVEEGAATDAQMIRNHRDAIEFLIDNAVEINFDRQTILNLHALLANNLLHDPMSAGRIRSIPVAIGESTYLPLDVPSRVEAYLDLTLEKAAQIENPFEQSLMVLAFLPYLQPFDDVNKRVSRLAANIPFIKNNLIPISFIDVSTDLYLAALIGFYELNDLSLLKDLYIWAYNRSSKQYAAVLQQLGAPDPFRMKYREQLLLLVQDIITRMVDRKNIGVFIKQWSKDIVPDSDQELFRQVAEVEILSLHEGNFARYKVRPSEFRDWKSKWDTKQL